jgi:hypothetical protein
MVIQRLSGDAPPDYLVAPLWCLDKPALLDAIRAELDRRDTWQGFRYAAANARKIETRPHLRPLPLVP